MLNNVGYDANTNDKLWVRAQSIVDGKTRAVGGLVNVRKLPALKSKFGLVAGNVREDLGSTVTALDQQRASCGVLPALLGDHAARRAGRRLPAPASGVTGLRCGLLEDVDRGEDVHHRSDRRAEPGSARQHARHRRQIRAVPDHRP